MGDTHTVRIGRVYDRREHGDGARVLVDRIWPRGMTKEKADLDEWCKEIAPSNELRKWYNHAPERFQEFTRRYEVELSEPARAEAVERLAELARAKTLTLLTASKAVDISEATVLAAVLRRRRSDC